jgi:hypothetical protein
VRVEVLVFCEDCPDRRACGTPQDRCQIVKLVAASTRAQGLPMTVADPEVLAAVRTLFG